MILSREIKRISGKAYYVVPAETKADALFMVLKKSDLPKCKYPVRIATRFNQGWGVSSCPPEYGTSGHAYAEIWTKEMAKNLWKVF